MELEGRIIKVMPAQSGISQRTGNAWKSQEYVFEYFYFPNQTIPTKVVMRVFGEDRINRFNLEANDEVKVRYHFDAHEANGRWFNEINIDGVTFVGASASKNEQPQQTAQSANDDPLNGPSDEAPY